MQTSLKSSELPQQWKEERRKCLLTTFEGIAVRSSSAQDKVLLSASSITVSPSSAFVSCYRKENTD